MLKVNDLVIGWHYSLASPVQTQIDNLIIDVIATRPTESHLSIGLAYRAVLAKQPWPAWKSIDTCPINGRALGETVGEDEEKLTWDLDNRSINLMGLRFVDERSIVWCNRHALLKALGEGRRTLPAEVSIFLSRLSAAASARSIPSTQLSRAFPIVFDPQIRLHLPVLVFDNHLAWLDLSYSGAFSGRSWPSS